MTTFALRMKFSETIGNDAPKAALRRLLADDRLPHAVLLGGPAGTGKLAAARALAAAVHCEAPVEGEACGCCPSCRQHAGFNHPDMHFVYPVVKGSLKSPLSTDYLPQWRDFLASVAYPTPKRWAETIEAGNSQPVIYVSEADAIVLSAAMSPLVARKKIYLIWQSEKMNADAANKLLKVLEEPFADTLFILVSDDPARLLPTIFSRVQRFMFAPLGESEVVAALRKAGVSAAEAASIAPLSGGRLDVAFAAASGAGEREEFAGMFQELMRLAWSRDMLKLRARAEAWAPMGREKLRRFMDYCASMVRENFIYNVGRPELNRMFADESKFSARFAPFIHAANVEGLHAAFSRAASDIERNAASRIVLFDTFLLTMQYIRTPIPQTT